MKQCSRVLSALLWLSSWLSALRLTDRCGPFRNGDSNSSSAAEHHRLARFVTGVAAMDRSLSRGQAGTLGTLIEVWSPREARRRGRLSDASALVKLLFEDWLPHDHNCVAGSPSVTSGAATKMGDYP